MSEETYTIGAFANAAGVHIETIRFYQRKGLLLTPEMTYGGIRRYSGSDVLRVKFIKSAQRLGFSLDEITQLLKLEDGGSCVEVAEIAAHRLADIRLRIADLARIEAVLSPLLDACHTQQGSLSCPLVASLHKAIESG